MSRDSNSRSPSIPEGYTGRFAPSPTGPLHAGSLVAALASWLDARAWGLKHPGQRNQWLVRIEDLDQPRCVAGAGEFILQQLAQCGLVSDTPPLWQSKRTALYQAALEQLVATGCAYPCSCSRQDIRQALATLGVGRVRHAELVYPGSCRAGLHGRPARAWRFAAPAGTLHWQDRRLGTQQQDVSQEVGDFVLQRADGLHAYQLAVVVDDAAQGVTHVVRGADLADNTPRQILLQRALRLPTPQYLHGPLVLGLDGEKLSKQNGAQTLDLSDPMVALNTAAAVLGLPAQSGSPALALQAWLPPWSDRWHA